MTQTQLAYIAIPQGLSPLKHCSMALIRVQSRAVLAVLLMGMLPSRETFCSPQWCQPNFPAVSIPYGVHFSEMFFGNSGRTPWQSTCSTQNFHKHRIDICSENHISNLFTKRATLLVQISINFVVVGILTKNLVQPQRWIHRIQPFHRGNPRIPSTERRHFFHLRALIAEKKNTWFIHGLRCLYLEPTFMAQVSQYISMILSSTLS